jgi:hypothetical protein
MSRLPAAHKLPRAAFPATRARKSAATQ